MSRVVYVNGRYRPYAEAAVHVEDRGFQFADAIYEVIEVRERGLVDATRHMVRLDRSLAAIDIAQPMTRAALLGIIGETIRRNRVSDGIVYVQITRGAAPRDFTYPDEDVPATVVCVARAHSRSRLSALAETGIAVKSLPDNRWGRCDIKTVMLLPACLAKAAARAEGAREAWFIDADGFVIEGASSNAWIVTEEGELVTRPPDEHMLSGITRATALDVAAVEGFPVIIRPFKLEEAYRAREAFVTAASNTVLPVVRIDSHRIGAGTPGVVARHLRSRFHHVAEISIV